MAIIYSYPKVTSPLATDVLVLTDTTLTAGKRKNKTKSLAMSDLAAYVVSSTSGITGGGTKDYIPLWTPDGNTIGDSIMFKTNTNTIQVGTYSGPGQQTVLGAGFISTSGIGADQGSFTNITSGQAGVVTIRGNATIGDAATDELRIISKVFDSTETASTAAGEVLLSTAAGQLVWAPAPSGGTVTGTGTTNTLPIFTDGPSGILGDSIITQAASGQGVTVTGGLDVTEDLNVTGSSEFLGNVSINEGLFDGDGSAGTAGQVLSSTGTQTEWVDSSVAITKLIPYFQLATPGGSDTYTQSNNIVDFDWSGGSGTYEYILPSATAIPYRTIRFVNNSTITASDKIHITAPGTETIDGGAFYSINKPYNGCAVWSDGVQWIVIQAKA